MASTLKVDTITTPDGTGDITFSRPIVGNLTAQKNIIINGDFDIWQRGTSFAAAAHRDYIADRWSYSKVGAMVHTISRDTDVPTVAESGHLSSYSMKIDCTTVDSSMATGDICALQYRMEGYDWKYIAQQAITLSFWHKHTKTGTYCIAIKNSGADKSWVQEYTQTTTNTWEKATLTIDASPSAGTWNYTNGVGVFLCFTLAAGATYQGTTDTWNSANNDATSSQVNACDNTANNFMLSQVQLEAGSVATDFEVKNHADELARCQRYFEILNGDPILAANVYGTGQCISTSEARCPIMYKVKKRSAPTITDSGDANFRITNAAYSAVEVTSLSWLTLSRTSVLAVITGTATPLIAGNATVFKDDGESQSTISISAEL